MNVDFTALSRRSIEEACQLLGERAQKSEQKIAELTEKESDYTLRIESLKAQLREHELQLQLYRDRLFGRKSEKVKSTDDEIQTSFLGAEAENVEAPEDADNQGAEAGEDADETEDITYTRKKKGRRAVSKELPEKVIVLHATDEERIGPEGQRLVSLGYDVTTRLDYVPERIIRLIIKREKLGLPTTREYVSTVKHTPSLVSAAKATDHFMLHVTLRKYVMGLPLYRQTAHFNRMGADLSDNYLGECVRHIAAAFAPIVAAIREAVVQQRWVFVDETPIRHLRDGPSKKNAQAKKHAITSYLWAWVAGKQTYFHFGATRSAKEVRDVLGIPYDPDDPVHGVNDDLNPDNWEHGSHIGFVMCDGYSGYNPLFKAEAIQRAACWVHARRPFKQMSEYDGNARRVNDIINTMFSCEKKIHRALEKRHKKHGDIPRNTDDYYNETARQRHECMPPLIAELYELLAKLKKAYAPETTMGEAITYINNRRQELELFIKHGFLPMENNTAERAIRPIAVGRKNWLFVGSEDAGTWAATMFSIIESCRLQKIHVEKYCEYVLDQIVKAPDRSAIDYSKLTPAQLRNQLK